MNTTTNTPLTTLAEAIEQLADAYERDMAARRAQAETNFKLVAAMKAVGAAYCPASDAAEVMGMPLPDCFLHNGLFVTIAANGKVSLRDQAFTCHYGLTLLARMAENRLKREYRKP